jgi:DNA-binding protein HU-beta
MAAKKATAPTKPSSGKPLMTAKAAVPKPAALKAATLPPKKAAPATITLRHLAAELTERHEMPKKQADTLLTDIVDMLVAHLKSGDRLRLGGLGILEVKNRPARMGRNPATGEAIQIKASQKIAFRAAKELKEAI